MDAITPSIVELEEQEAMCVRGEVTIPEMPAFFGSAFAAVAEAAAKAGAELVGPPFGFYPTMPTDTVVVEAGFPVSRPGVEGSGEVHRLVLPGGEAVVAMHVGSYDSMDKTYEALAAWMESEKRIPAAGVWEVYLSDPAEEPDPSTWRTQIVWPLA